MFISNEWLEHKLAKTMARKKVEKIILQTRFWSSMNTVLRVFKPLVDVLRLVDSDDKPVMGYIYKAMDRAKEQIKVM